MNEEHGRGSVPKRFCRRFGQFPAGTTGMIGVAPPGEAGASGWANVTVGAERASPGPAAGKLRADCRTLPARAHPAIGASANSGANSQGIQIRPPPTRAPPGTRAPAGSRRWGDGVGTGGGSRRADGVVRRRPAGSPSTPLPVSTWQIPPVGLRGQGRSAPRNRGTKQQWPRRELNPHGDCSPQDFKSRASAYFATRPKGALRS